MISLDPRLQAAFSLLANQKTVADIGCDHGRLAVALCQGGAAERVIGVDISESSLNKAHRLVDKTALGNRIELRAGDGLSALHAGECGAISILGLGGTLIAKMLQNSDPPLAGADFAVLQPMTAAEDLRRWLYENCYHITNERLVRDGWRIYQLIKVRPCAERQIMPRGFPPDCFFVGFTAVAQKEPLLPALLERQRGLAEKCLRQSRGTRVESKFVRRIEDIKITHKLWEETICT